VDHRSGLSLSVAPTNFDQLWWALEAFGLIWKKEQTLGLILERKRIRGSGKTANFKPPTFREFQNVADNHQAQKLNRSSIRPELVGGLNEF
jgi:hypothetical protein